MLMKVYGSRRGAYHEHLQTQNVFFVLWLATSNIFTSGFIVIAFFTILFSQTVYAAQ